LSLLFCLPAILVGGREAFLWEEILAPLKQFDTIPQSANADSSFSQKEPWKLSAKK
jgi:hypothetical protein